jgi:MoaA/NifB/PqqE/SkfB family radical SAM enzyme
MSAASPAPDVAAASLVRAREPDQQVEIQLGHLCNNRCTFCVSGQRTARGQAGVSPIDPILAHIRDARARGHDKITLLGGEPTLQPGFLTILEECAALGFSEVVVFTNGAKTASGKLIDQALATGAKIAFRISIQGATKASHERTTLKPGSFGRIEATLSELRSRGLKTTVNMCLVSTNHDDLHAFAPLLQPFGVQQLHVDLMRPLDAGDRSDDELRETLAPLDRIGASLTRMVEAFDPSFDVNVGNLPFCLAPSIADRIHHDGQATETIAIDGGDAPSAPWDKYATKRRDKVKPERCATCVFDSQCTGIYADYLRLQGDAAIAPVTVAQLDGMARAKEWTALRAAATLKRLEHAAARDGFVLEVQREGLEAARIRVLGPNGATEVRLGSSGRARYARFSLELLSSMPTTTAWLTAQLDEDGPIAPLVDLSGLPAPLAAAAVRVLSAAPFGELVMRDVRASEHAVILPLHAASGARAEVTLGLDAAGKVALKYTVHGTLDEASRATFAASLGALMDALRRPSRA